MFALPVKLWQVYITPAFHSLIYTADRDYHPLRRIITFDSSDMMRSHQCLQIEIIDDSLGLEEWEMFSVLLSTNSSAVNLTRQEFDVFIDDNGII